MVNGEVDWEVLSEWCRANWGWLVAGWYVLAWLVAMLRIRIGSPDFFGTTRDTEDVIFRRFGFTLFSPIIVAIAVIVGVVCLLFGFGSGKPRDGA